MQQVTINTIEAKVSKNGKHYFAVGLADGRKASIWNAQLAGFVIPGNTYSVDLQDGKFGLSIMGLSPAGSIQYPPIQNSAPQTASTMTPPLSNGVNKPVGVLSPKEIANGKAQERGNAMNCASRLVAGFIAQGKVTEFDEAVALTKKLCQSLLDYEVNTPESKKEAIEL